MDNFQKNTTNSTVSTNRSPLAQNEYSALSPVITSYDPKKGTIRTDLSDFVYAKYKSDKNNVPVEIVAGSTLPLVELAGDEEIEDEYDPFEHRKISHPTSDLDTLAHLLKGSLGSGILAMPIGFLNAGLWFGLIATFVIGFICTYCVHVIVKCSQILCRRAQIPSLGFADIAETAFLAGPESVRKYSRLARFLINTFLVTDLLGCCCVYVVFVAHNIKQVVDYYTDSNLDVRLYMLMLLLPLILINLIRKLKWLTPFSMIANVLIVCGMGITFYYILTDLPPTSDRPAIAHITYMPLFFGTVIFALEGIGVVMPLENNMKNPRHFLGCPGVLNIGMGFVVTLYAVTGFLGYLKFGDATQGSITLNLPVNELLAQSVKIMIAIAVFLTFSLQFYVPMEIIWKNFRGYCSEYKNVCEYGLRVVLVCLTVFVAVAVPNLEPLIGLIGAVCLSTLGMMFPAIIELVTYWERPGMGKYNWRLWKNIFLIIFGLIGFSTGTYTSITEIVKPHH